MPFSSTRGVKFRCPGVPVYCRPVDVQVTTGRAEL